MNTLFVATFATLAAFACAAPSGIHGAGAVVSGPSGIVTSHGAIGPAGHGLGLGLGGLGLGGVGLGGLGLGGVGLGGLGLGGLGLGGLGLGHGAVVAAPAVAYAAPVASAVVAGPALGLGLGVGHGVGLGLGHGLGVVTNGGGTIGVSGHGAAIRGPATAPVVIAGPSGKVVADGLWGPTANVGLTGGHGGWAHGGHGW